MPHSPYPAIHTAANARAEAVEAEVEQLRTHADELLSLIDELCGPAEPAAPAGPRRRHRDVAA